MPFRFEASEEFGRSIIDGGGANSRWHCGVCGVNLQTEDQSRAHISGWKHGEPVTQFRLPVANA